MQFIIQKKYLIFSIIFFLIFGFIFLFLYRTINDNKELSKLQQEKWQEENKKEEKFKNIKNLLKTLEVEKTSLDSHFVTKSDVVPFLNTIEKITESVGAYKTEVVSVDVPPGDPSLLVEVRVAGSFDSVYKLITLLENSPYNLEFVSANLQNTTREGNAKAKQWVGTFTLRLLNFSNE